MSDRELFGSRAKLALSRETLRRIQECSTLSEDEAIELGIKAVHKPDTNAEPQGETPRGRCKHTGLWRSQPAGWGTPWLIDHEFDAIVCPELIKEFITATPAESARHLAHECASCERGNQSSRAAACSVANSDLTLGHTRENGLCRGLLKPDLVERSDTLPAVHASLVIALSGPCVLPHCFDLTTSGSRLGEFSAILTALTFTAIIFLADRGSGNRGHEETQVMLLGAFVALATAAYLFAGVAAEEGEGPRTAFEAFSASLVLSVALQLLFLGISQLLRHREFVSATLFTVRVSNWFVGPTIFAYMSATAVGAVGLYAPSDEAYRSGTALLCAAMFIAIIVWVVLTRVQREHKWPAKIQPTPAQWAGGCIGVVALSSILTLIWAEMNRSHAMPAWAYVLFMGLLLVAILGYSLQLTLIEADTQLSSAATKNRAANDAR